MTDVCKEVGICHFLINRKPSYRVVYNSLIWTTCFNWKWTLVRITHFYNKWNWGRQKSKRNQPLNPASMAFYRNIGINTIIKTTGEDASKLKKKRYRELVPCSLPLKNIWVACQSFLQRKNSIQKSVFFLNSHFSWTDHVKLIQRKSHEIPN